MSMTMSMQQDDVQPVGDEKIVYQLTRSFNRGPAQDVDRAVKLKSSCFNKARAMVEHYESVGYELLWWNDIGICLKKGDLRVSLYIEERIGVTR